MQDINNISKIGFGCHHVSAGNKDHAEALKHAIQSGCNIIDTSSNYSNGKAEELIGEVLTKETSSKCFVMTKGGNISEENLPLLNKLNIDPEQLTKIGENVFHCINPVYLEAQLQVSLKRMRRDYVDGYFLHNPEFYLTSNKTANDTIYYNRIQEAFTYLEEQVKKGKIRYYGISESTGITDITRLIQLAESISPEHHFKLMQFPYNIEQQFVQEKKEGETTSALDRMKAAGIFTFGNRPLSFRKNNNTYRLIRYEHAVEEADVLSAMDEAFACIEEQLEKKDRNTDLTEIFVVKYLYEQWQNLESDNFFSALYESYFMTFVNDLFDHQLPDDKAECFRRLQEVLKQYLQNKMFAATKVVLKEKGMENLLEAPNPVRRICASYLQEGPGHVLLGMRNKEYVNAAKELF